MLRPRFIRVKRGAMPKRPGRPDFNQQIHAIFEHVAAGESPDANGEPAAPSEEAKPEKPPEREKDPAAVSLGRRGGLKGGKKRMEGLSAEERRELGKKAAEARWGKKD